MSGLSSPGEGILSSGTPGFSWWTSARLWHLVRSNVRHVPDFLSSWAPSWGHVPRCRECLGQSKGAGGFTGVWKPRGRFKNRLLVLWGRVFMFLTSQCANQFYLLDLFFPCLMNI